MIKRIGKTKNGSFDYEGFNEIVDKWKDVQSPVELYKSLFYKRDMGILFGPPHCGKDLFAIMIGEESCKKMKEGGYNDFTVLYVDFEKSQRQQVLRYVDAGGQRYHEFSENLIMVSYKNVDCNKLTPDILYKELSEIIDETNAEVVIINNLTYLCRGQMGSVAAEFMQSLKYLQNDKYISMLVLVHTQRADDFKPITLRDLKGSDFLLTIADSIFAMNISRRDKDIRYVKQFKSQCSEIEYGADNVLVYKMERGADGALWPNFKETTPEAEQLDIDIEAERNFVYKIRSLYNNGWSIRKIAEEFKLSRMRVWRNIQGV
ncbi:MAG: AAA family ATPase [Prevotella sp.]|nr:AAA family ATPase [Prevotella sp.]